MAEKKKVKNLIKFRDSHRNFVRKTIAEAKELISGGNPIEVRKLKLLRTSLQTKCSELQVLDRGIVELLEDVSKIDSDVSESCELISVIQECMVDLESALTAQESQGKKSAIEFFGKRGNCSRSPTGSSHARKASQARAEEISRKPHRVVSLLGIFRISSS